MASQIQQPQGDPPVEEENFNDTGNVVTANYEGRETETLPRETFETPLRETTENLDQPTGRSRRTRRSHLIEGSQVTHQDAILQAIHDAVVVQQSTVDNLNWTQIFRTTRRLYPSSFPFTSDENNGGRSCHLWIDR